MPSSDRAFRALAQAEPDVVVALLRVLAPRLVPTNATIAPEAVDDPRLLVSPPVDADWIARIGAPDVLHLECQGYRDGGFPDRTFYYHLSSVVRYRPRRVRTVALWLITPPKPQRRSVIRVHDITVRVTTLALPEIPAALLLTHARTACFAPGADAGGLPALELCRRAARVMKRGGASWNQRHMAVIAAAMRGRYEEMVQAMDEENMEPVIIEDLVKFGEDRGFAKGELKMARKVLLDICEVRGIELAATARARVQAETSVDILGAWLKRAANAKTWAEVLGD